MEKVQFQRIYDCDTLKESLKELESVFVKPGSSIPLVIINSVGAFLSDTTYENSGMRGIGLTLLAVRINLV